MAGVLATRLSSRITSLWHKRSAHPHSQRLDMLLHFLRQSPTTALACACVGSGDGKLWALKCGVLVGHFTVAVYR